MADVTFRDTLKDDMGIDPVGGETSLKGHKDTPVDNDVRARVTASGQIALEKSESAAWNPAELLIAGVQLNGNSGATAGEDIFELYSESDLPAPSVGVSTLTSGKYVMKKAFSLSTIEEFQCAAGAVIEWTSEDKENHTLTHVAASKTLFNLTGGSRFKIEHASFKLTGNGAKFINLTGAGFNSKVNDFRVTFTGTGTTIADTLNTASGTNEFVDGTMVGFQNGITIDNSEGIQLLGLFLASDTTGTNAIVNIQNISGVAINLNNNVFVGGASQSAYYIDPTIAVPIQIRDSNTSGIGPFFKAGGLDESSKYVTAENNGPYRDSRSMASAYATGNIATTSITGVGTYDPLNLGTALVGQSNELFTLLSTVTGEMRYDGLVPLHGVLTCSLSAKRSGGAVQHNFRAFKTSGTVAFDPIVVSRDLGTTLGAMPLVLAATLEPGEQFRIEVEATSGTTEITVSEYSLVVV